MVVVRLFTLRLTLLLILHASAVAQEAAIEIKGIRVGMTKQQLNQTIPSWSGFTIAGVPPMFHELRSPAVFHAGRLDRFVYMFLPEHFNTMHEALLEKYPALQCKSLVKTDTVGESAESTECGLADKDSVLLLSKYSVDRNTSLIGLYSRRYLEEEKQRKLKTKKDI